eukprot:scaffold25997_cov68-Cyclotella_meneghiniana.AAC.1
MLTKIPMSVAVKATAKAKAKKKSPTNKELFFPGKLYKLLLDPKSEGIICWMDHGRSWKIVDRKRIGGMLQKYFRHENVESFIRSVNGWGFKRIKTEGPDKNSYYHPYFLRGLPVLYQELQRLYNYGESLSLPDKPNLSETADSNPLPFDGIERDFQEALAYVHIPSATSSKFTMPLDHLVHEQPYQSTDGDGVTMPMPSF